MSTAPVDNGDLHGHGHELGSAIQDAWNQRPHGGPTEYIVAETTVTGTNPITGYSVVLKRPS